METYTFKDQNVYFKLSSYRNNSTLAVMMYSIDDKELIDVITVNLNSPMQDYDTAFVDENNIPGIGDWLELHGIATPLGVIQRSGFCSYRLYAFHF